MNMTNTDMLEAYIAESGKKKGYLAQKCGLSLAGFRNCCINKAEFKASQIQILCEELGVPVSYLMDWEEKPTAQGSELSEGMMELVDCIKKLPEDKIQMLLQVARSIR